LAVVVVDDAADLGAGRDWLEPDPGPPEGCVGVAELRRLGASGPEIAELVGDAEVAPPIVGVVKVPTFTG
jgi:hypothetical protein